MNTLIFDANVQDLMHKPGLSFSCTKQHDTKYLPDTNTEKNSEGFTWFGCKPATLLIIHYIKSLQYKLFISTRNFNQDWRLGPLILTISLFSLYSYMSSFYNEFFWYWLFLDALPLLWTIPHIYVLSKQPVTSILVS